MIFNLGQALHYHLYPGQTPTRSPVPQELKCPPPLRSIVPQRTQYAPSMRTNVQCEVPILVLYHARSTALIYHIKRGGQFFLN